MKLWDKGQQHTSDIIDRFTVGSDRVLDLEIAGYDLRASKAHARMLNSAGILSQREMTDLVEELDRLLEEVEEGSFAIEEEFEDIHSKIEYELTRKLGETGKKIHAGRSRNDQVLVCLHLYAKEQIREIKKLVKALFDRFMSLSGQHREVIIPGYTHMQVAMPSSFGLWFGAYAESLVDDLEMVKAAWRICNKNPLGSAAGYGSSFPLNRKMTTELLGFDDLNYNVVYAQMGRGKTERIIAQALSSIAATLGKFSMDVCLFNSQNFGFISFPAHLTTGSSIMPHKKNPDVFELIRSKCNILQALPNEIAMMTTNLPTGYQRDLHLLKEGLFPAFETLIDCLSITTFMLDNIIINENNLK